MLKYLKRLQRIKIFFLILVKKLIKFILPNLSAILKRRIDFKTIPNCNQKTLITGTGKVKIGNKCMFGYKPGGHYWGGVIELQPRYQNSVIEIGEQVATNNNLCIIAANKISIGNKCRIGEHVTIMDFEAHGTAPDKRNELGEIGVVEIGENVWLGNNVMVLKNSNIGKNSIVAAGAVVNGVFPENVIIGGVPAKIIKSI
jgi:acetyltransferase-like isoleucine patch superfamily enzyme